MIFRARTRNSSGGVPTSRSWRRLSATSGCLLTLSDKSVASDQAPQRVDRHLEHAIHVGGVEMMDLTGSNLVHAKVDRSGAQLAEAGHDKQRRRLHIVAKDPGPLPHLQLLTSVWSRHRVGLQVRIERIDRPDD